MNGLDEIIKNGTSIAASIIGLAILGTIIRNASGTVNILNATSTGFSKVLSTAMGGSSSISGVQQ
jgi:hypothetical protein